MPQEFDRSLQDNVEKKGTSPSPTDEKTGQVIDYIQPEYYEYYQSSELASNQSARRDIPYEYPAPPDYNDYTHPSHYGVFPSGGNRPQESYTPVSVEWNPGDEERGKTQQWQQEKVKNGRVRGGLAGLGGLAVTIGAWLLKLQGLAFLLKFGAAGFTALISVAFYSLAFGWAFAFAFVGLIFIHEMGHVIAVKAKGLPVKGMIFIPFLGAAVAWSKSRNIKDEAEVAIAGPLAGAAGALICLGIAALFPHLHTMWLPLAYVGFFLNLINLAPVWPLDGGRIFDAIDRRASIVGFVVLLVLQIWFWLQGNFSLWLLFLLILAGSRLFLTHKQTTQNMPARSQNVAGASSSPYHKISTSSRITLAILYFALVIALSLGMTITHSFMGL